MYYLKDKPEILTSNPVETLQGRTRSTNVLHQNPGHSRFAILNCSSAL